MGGEGRGGAGLKRGAGSGGERRRHLIAEEPRAAGGTRRGAWTAPLVRRGPKRAEKSRKEPNGAEWGRMGGTGRAEMRSGDGEWGERGLIKVGGLINEVCGGGN